MVRADTPGRSLLFFNSMDHSLMANRPQALGTREENISHGTTTTILPLKSCKILA